MFMCGIHGMRRSGKSGLAMVERREQAPKERQIDGRDGRGAGGDEFGVELSANEGTEAGGRG